MDGAKSQSALVVDDSKIQCRLIEVMLNEMGYSVVVAHNGIEAVEAYSQYLPDIVLMDINMPLMNGFDAARQIKQQQTEIAPIIFITSLNSEDAYVEAIEAGGDDVLVRPFSPAVFKAKIKAVQRTSNLIHRVIKLQENQQQDTEIAEALFSKTLESQNFATNKISILKQPADIFSGDIHLSSLSPNGCVHVLLGDFTGHGLRSSIGAIPLAEAFNTMTKKGFSIQDIIKQINHTMYKLLPADMFLAGCFVSVDPNNNTAIMINAGLPCAYIINQQGNIKHKVSSNHPPIGVVADLLPITEQLQFTVNPQDHIVLVTDGIPEAVDINGNMFGEQRVEACFNQIEGGAFQLSQALKQSVCDYLGEEKQQDDISAIVIPCSWPEVENNALGVSLVPEIENLKPVVSLNASINKIKASWSWQIELNNEKLKTINPVPIMMSHIQEFEGKQQHWQNLYTILTELYVNALDHGVLGLDSSLKASTDGFLHYFNEREKKLSTLNKGFIKISLHFYQTKNGGQVHIIIKDSGKGFDTYNALKTLMTEQVDEESKALSGRGIKLINSLCDTIDYRENGTLVEARYLWS